MQVRVSLCPLRNKLPVPPSYPRMPTPIPDLDAAQFETETAPSSPAVLVDFYSPFCMPCREMLPLLAEVAEERQLRIVKINTDQHPDLAARCRVKAVPNLVLFRAGQPIAQRIGRVPKRELLAWLDPLLA